MRHAPLDAERTQDVHAIVPVRRAVRVARVPLERGEFGARARDGLHLRELQRAEVPVERVHRVPVCVAGDGRRDELRGDFLQREKVCKASVLNHEEQCGRVIPCRRARLRVPVPTRSVIKGGTVCSQCALTFFNLSIVSITTGLSLPNTCGIILDTLCKHISARREDSRDIRVVSTSECFDGWPVPTQCLSGVAVGLGDDF